MRLELKQLNITRFRGLQNISFSFEEPETWIYGRNGSGKTSLFDSFVWCLFGKDHLGRADYEIKPYDKAGKIIPRTDVEVEAIILVDGAMRKLRRCYQEVWVKPKTEIEEVSKGHTTEYFIDDVKVSKSRYDNLVSTLCDDIVFKTITNPLFFTSLKQDEQRKLLFSMVSITDEEIAEENDDFKKLLSDLTGISIEEYKKSINTQKARIKPELTGLPERIAGLKEGMPEMPDEARISSEISLKQALVDEIEQALNDAAANAENQNRVRMSIQAEINKLELQQQEIRYQHSSKLNEQKAEIRSQIAEVEFKIINAKKQAELVANRRIALEADKGAYETKLQALREKWKTIKAEELIFDEHAFKCPTCERLLEAADIDAKQQELTAKFNTSKTQRLEANKTEGLAVVERLKSITQELEQLNGGEKQELFIGTRLDSLNSQLAALDQKNKDFEMLNQYIENSKLIEGLKFQLSTVTNTVDNSQLIDEKRQLTRELDELKSKIALKDVINNTKTRIAQLEERVSILNQELASLERKEFIAKKFEFEKNTRYEEKINQMFRFVKFRLFKTQVDGQIIPIFECMVDGVPFSTLNNAMQIAAGLDIIHAISNKHGVSAPIWIDNRESVTEIPKMETQIINLVVDPRYFKLQQVQTESFELKTA
ncbi:MAG: hypothetical protein BGP01_03330 [Paludibacter sp. 47-17]|nr:MAG: hypothetical protein BGP01_03330 [Paludibacter sp. 47-17]